VRPCNLLPPTTAVLQATVLHVRRNLLCHHLQGWGLHVWGSVAQPTPWSKPLPPSGLGPDGPYWDIQLTAASRHVGVLIHKGEEKAAGVLSQLTSSGRRITSLLRSSNVCSQCPTVVDINDSSDLHHCWPCPAGAEHIDPSNCSEVWLAQAEQQVYSSLPDMSHIAAGTLFKSCAHW
jgi:hypothetical protein